MTFIMLVIIAVIIGYGIVLAKENIEYVESINRMIREEREYIQMERKQKWEDTNNKSKTS
jgi:uncharacterized protein YxeA|tara:strand:+ start:364 stop:543 length:180 start_codon:yes stop_codon:yes gene_type:complete